MQRIGNSTYQHHLKQRVCDRCRVSESKDGDGDDVVCTIDHILRCSYGDRYRSETAKKLVSLVEDVGLVACDWLAQVKESCVDDEWMELHWLVGRMFGIGMDDNGSNAMIIGVFGTEMASICLNRLGVRGNVRRAEVLSAIRMLLFDGMCKQVESVCGSCDI
jgi:hypothetical protein